MGLVQILMYAWFNIKFITNSVANSYCTIAEFVHSFDSFY